MRTSGDSGVFSHITGTIIRNLRVVIVTEKIYFIYLDNAHLLHFRCDMFQVSAVLRFECALWETRDMVVQYLLNPSVSTINNVIFVNRMGYQVWSLTQFYSVDFLKSRISVKVCFRKIHIKVCVSCFYRVMGPHHRIDVYFDSRILCAFPAGRAKKRELTLPHS